MLLQTKSQKLNQSASRTAYGESTQQFERLVQSTEHKSEL
jgi:hypothetical protein